jgi:hypothetical protein
MSVVLIIVVIIAAFIAWIAISIHAGEKSSNFVGWVVFLFPFIYITCRIYSDYKTSNKIVVFIGIVTFIIHKQTEYSYEKHKKELKKEEDERHEISIANEIRKEKVTKAASYIYNTRDEESAELFGDYRGFYLAGKMPPELIENFEDRLIAKAQPAIDAEKLRKKEEATLAKEEEERRLEAEREEYDRNVARLTSKYGQSSS